MSVFSIERSVATELDSLLLSAWEEHLLFLSILS
jgi:hypothetical protein